MATAQPAPMPAAVELGPFRYTVTTAELDLLRAAERQRSTLMGHADHETLTVVVDGRMAVGAQRETLMHELLHVVTEVAGLNSTWSSADEEANVRRLSPIVLELLRRNPAAVAFLTEAD